MAAGAVGCRIAKGGNEGAGEYAFLLKAESPNFALRSYPIDRKSTRLNSSHGQISYAVFCLKKTTAIFIVYFLLIVVLPFAVLLWSSFQRFYSVPSWQALNNLTLDPYRFIFTYPNLVRSVWNTLILSFGSATVIMLVTSVICWIVVKTKLPGRWLLDNVASLPRSEERRVGK